MPSSRDQSCAATWHDCWPGAVFYAPSESGELAPFLDMNGGSGGGGAQPIDDGLDCAGSLTLAKPVGPAWR